MLGIPVNLAKAAEPIEMPLGAERLAWDKKKL